MCSQVFGKGYTRYCVQDEVYPAAVAAESEDAFVSGIVMHINDGNEMKVLDQYEGSVSLTCMY